MEEVNHTLQHSLSFKRVWKSNNLVGLLILTIKDTPLGIDTSILGFIASVTWDQGATLSTGEVAEMSSSLDLANCEKETYIQNILQKVCTSRDFLKQCLLVSFPPRALSLLLSSRVHLLRFAPTWELQHCLRNNCTIMPLPCLTQIRFSKKTDSLSLFQIDLWLRVAKQIYTVAEDSSYIS